MTSTKDNESAHSVHIGFGSEKDAKASSDDSKLATEGTDSTLNEKAEVNATGPVAKQPEPTPELPVTKLEEGKSVAPPPPPQAAVAAKSTGPSVWRSILRVFMTIVLGIGRVFLILLAVIGIVAVFLLFSGIGFAVAAGNGALIVFVGNAIMYKAGSEGSGYSSSHAKAATVGAVGGILAAMIVGVVVSFIPRRSSNGQPPQHPWYVQIATTVLGGTLSGAIGSAILLRNGHDLKGLDILHATRAGAVGGAIFGPGAIILLPVMIIVIGLILSPLWIAMSMGFKFVHSKSRESWTENSYRYSGCHCWGTCGEEDPEIQSEILKIQERQRAL